MVQARVCHLGSGEMATIALISDLASQDHSLVFQAKNSCQISNCVDVETDCSHCLMSTL